MDKKRKTKVGVVLKHSGDKTATVLVERLVKHPHLQKYVTRRKKFHVHDERNEAAAGDKVEIVECRPMSKTKSWKVNSIIEKAV